MTLNGPSAASVTNDCARWLSPTPVLPAITAGTQPPLGVTETTQPLSSAASIEVVPAVNWRRNSSSGPAGASLAAITIDESRTPVLAVAPVVEPPLLPAAPAAPA